MSQNQHRAYNNRTGIREYNSRPASAAAVKIQESVVDVGSIDYSLVVIVVILVLTGIVMVTSSSYLTAASLAAAKGDMFYFLKKDAVFAVAGFAIMILMSNVNYKYLRRPTALLSYLVANALQLVVVFIGISSHGKERWIKVPVINQFQPSEVAKVALILFLSLVISSNKHILKKWGGFIFCCAIAGVTAGLALMGSLSAAIIIGVTGIGIIFVASSYVLRFLVAGAAGVGGVAFFIFFLSEGFRVDRVTAWLRPFDDPLKTSYQVVQSLYAIASGGMFGLGIGQSRQKSYLPEVHNDVIFAVICEELGLIGAAVILTLYGVLIWRGIKIAINAPDTFSSLVASGITILIASQTIINVAVVTNSIPNTGVTLPFISYGGTSLMVTMFMMGVLLNISRCSRNK